MRHSKITTKSCRTAKLRYVTCATDPENGFVKGAGVFGIVQENASWSHHAVTTAYAWYYAIEPLIATCSDSGTGIFNHAASFWGSRGKQRQSISCDNHTGRHQSTLYRLCYPGSPILRPLCRTLTGDHLELQVSWGRLSHSRIPVFNARGSLMWVG